MITIIHREIVCKETKVSTSDRNALIIIAKEYIVSIQYTSLWFPIQNKVVSYTIALYTRSSVLSILLEFLCLTFHATTEVRVEVFSDNSTAVRA